MNTHLDYFIQFIAALVGVAYISFWYVLLLFALCGGLLAVILGYNKKQCLLAAASPLMLPFGLLLALPLGLAWEPLGYGVLLLLHFVFCRFCLKHPLSRSPYVYFFLSSAIFGGIWALT